MPTVRYGKNPLGETISGTTTINGNIGWKSNPLMIWKENQVKSAALDLFKEMHPEVNDELIMSFQNRLTEEVEKKSKGPMTAGTILHYMIECDLKNQKPDLTKYPRADLIELADVGFENYRTWKENVKFKPYKTEVSIIHKELWYGSTLDCLAWINDNFSLFDWKLASGIYEDYLIQIESYRHNWDFNNPDMPIKGMHLLKIDKVNAAYTHHYWEKSDEAWEAFLCALKLHKLHKDLKKML